LGNAEFWQGGNRFSGNRIQYDPVTERVIANAGEDDSATEATQDDDGISRRVTVTLQPKKKPQPETPQP
jgi:lipopolysaccharide export system protein LptA